MNKATKIIAAALVLAGLALAVLALILGRRHAPPAPLAGSPALAEQHAVVVAAQALPPGVPITAAALKLTPMTHPPAGSYANAADVIGQVPVVAVAAGAPIMPGTLAHGLATQLADGERAVAVPVNALSAVGNRIKPGDYVDVFFSLRLGQNAAVTQSRLLASRVRVLAYGAATLDNRNGDAKKGAAAAPASTAVLAVPVDGVNRLVLAAQNGKLTLALRAPNDDDVSDPALFPRPASVLMARNNLDPAQREALQNPDNRAFAGLALGQLSGKGDAALPAPAVHADGAARRERTVQVIRGARQQAEPY
ncbi:Flp pilus assembly protein CpaB [Pandoraea sp.]|uniref:Flp pilus assembly protein CpaB n=1 Tax=Pandoraea sp. TaxID=1883445 RepID=UPI0012172C44|nr:Flp pilus assembly protein CpaB [Pandoraea sp.]TAL54719.1 MAG: Flp pilus assembly protein CpaB [Pandoraea sp.]TAM18513.1 MAG: Flp pilus assembly protein CpaB [Pandoraea sp.]